jgi:hypothetical protein
MKIINGGDANPCSESTLDLLKSSTMKTREFDLNGKKLVCRLLAICDADTVWLSIVPYEGDCHRVRMRLLKLDSPEVNVADEKKLANKAKHELMRIVSPDLFTDDRRWEEKKDINAVLSSNVVLLYCALEKNDLYGRPLGTLWRTKDASVSINDQLLQSGCFDFYEGGTKTRSWVKKGTSAAAE